MAKEGANPFAISKTADTLEGRLGRETKAQALAGPAPGRRRITRPAQIALKTSPLKKQQLERLSLRLDSSMVVVFELALDALEEKLNAEMQEKQG